jgi:tRNASer (uridine44-2'-O)-methyltransferase
MAFQPHGYPPSGEPVLKDDSGVVWTPIYYDECSFPRKNFLEVMMNLVRNPNINSNHLFRGDILLETEDVTNLLNQINASPRLCHFDKFNLHTVIVRRLIPRNVLVDKPLDQTCLLYDGAEEEGDEEIKSLVVYLPHISSPSESPFYHPAVHGIGFLHTFNPQSKSGQVSIHYSFFDSAPQTPSLDRTALHLLAILHKHGHGLAGGYVKRFQHDMILPQAAVQDTYTRLKAKYARALIAGWVEATDPAKHVFEDLGIAAFLIELWADMYPPGTDFPGFVDIGCGNGLLVHLLIEEGYSGWGFDARRRKSWDIYTPKSQKNLKELVLIPGILQKNKSSQDIDTIEMHNDDKMAKSGLHDGTFPKGTFIISNHADELTPWTPILATVSECPFMAIPCCSHDLTGSRFRAPPPKEPGVSNSTYASLVSWVSELASDCGWELEKEMLRIPSTRKTALLGRKRTSNFAEIRVSNIVDKYGGAAGWEENAMKLVKSNPRAH